MIEASFLSAWIFPALLVLALVCIVWLLFLRKRQKQKGRDNRFTTEYYRGLNYLLNDEQDKALDVFVKLVETDWETIDTHFALGIIFRKNGEIDKAIKIHQGLIARPSLPHKYRNRVLLELGYDYLGAGWFDRAEGLFKEVLLHDPGSEKALRHLIMIYQQEKGWHKAIDTAQILFDEHPAEMGMLISQFYCELAAIARSKGDWQQMEHHASNALSFDENSVRATLILAESARRAGDCKRALQHFEKVEYQDAEFLPLIMDELVECYQQLGNADDLMNYLDELEKRHQDMPLFTSWTPVIERCLGREGVIDYISERLKKSPNLKGVKQLLSYGEDTDSERRRSIMHLLKSAIGRIQADETRYICRQCGFHTNTLYWLCPSCNAWSTVKPGLTHPPVPQNRTLENR